jgi:hypothetical protein
VNARVGVGVDVDRDDDVDPPCLDVRREEPPTKVSRCPPVPTGTRSSAMRPWPSDAG